MVTDNSKPGKDLLKLIDEKISLFIFGKEKMKGFSLHARTYVSLAIILVLFLFCCLVLSAVGLPFLGLLPAILAWIGVTSITSKYMSLMRESPDFNSNRKEN